MKKSLKVVLTGLLLVTMSMGVFGCGNKADQKPADQQDAKQEEKQPEGVPTVEDGKLRVAMECGYAPFNWTQVDDKNGAVPIESGSYANGYDVQIAKKIADSMGKELVIVKTNWDGLPPAVQSGTVARIFVPSSVFDNKILLANNPDYLTSLASMPEQERKAPKKSCILLC